MSNNIIELVGYVNEKLLEGLSTAHIEKQMGVGKDTLRKKLNRYNYKYDKVSKQYKLKSNIDETLDVKDDNKEVTHGVVTSCVTKITQTEFTPDEIEILRIIIKNYKRSNEFEGKFTGEVVTRSFRTYKNVIQEFVTYCNENNLSQKESIAIALNEFCKEIKK